MKTKLSNCRKRSESPTAAHCLRPFFALLCAFLLLLSLTAGFPVRAESFDESAELYVTNRYESTERGVRYIPQIHRRRLKQNPAVQAFIRKVDTILNEQDAHIEETIKEAEREGWELPDAQDAVLMDSAACLKEQILSVAVRYIPLTPDEPFLYHYISLNLDLRTGKELSYEDLLAKAGLTEDDVVFSLEEMGRQYLENQWLRMKFFQAGEAERLPDDSEQPFNPDDFAEQFELSLKYFDASLRGQKDEYGQIPDPPAFFYKGGDRLFLSAQLPCMAGAGFIEVMLPIAKNADQLRALSDIDCFAQEFLGKGPLSPEAALAAARKSFYVDENDCTKEGLQLHFRIAGMSNVALNEVHTEPSYLVEAYEDLEDHKSNVGWRYITVYSGDILEIDPVTDSWDFLWDDFSVYDSDPVMDGLEHDAAAIFISPLDAYEAWKSRPYFSANVPELLGVEPEAYQAEQYQMIYYCLITAIEPHTELTVEYGNSSGQWGVMDQTIYTVQLEPGEKLLLYTTEFDRHVGVRIKNGEGESFMNLSYLRYEPGRTFYLPYDFH